MNKLIILSIIFVLIISSCINQRKIYQYRKICVLPGVKVTAALFGQFIIPDYLYRDIRHECQIQDNDFKLLFLPTMEEITIAEHIVLHHFQKYYPNKYIRPIDYKRSFLGKSGRQYIGILCGRKKFIRINYLLWLGNRKTKKFDSSWTEEFIHIIHMDYSLYDKLSSYYGMETHIVNITDSTLVK